MVRQKKTQCLRQSVRLRRMAPEVMPLKTPQTHTTRLRQATRRCLDLIARRQGQVAGIQFGRPGLARAARLPEHIDNNFCVSAGFDPFMGLGYFRQGKNFNLRMLQHASLQQRGEHVDGGLPHSNG